MGEPVGVCTDGAHAMLGSQRGFVTRIKDKSPNAVGTHCVIHREALASRTLPAAMNEKLATTIRVVNFVKKSPVKSRLFAILCKDMDAHHQTVIPHSCWMVVKRQYISPGL